jgi:hypothetical protein
VNVFLCKESTKIMGDAIDGGGEVGVIVVNWRPSTLRFRSVLGGFGISLCLYKRGLAPTSGRR